MLDKVCDRPAFPGKGRLGVSVRGKHIAVFKVGDEFFALERYCSHAGGDLLDGMVENGTVACPVHGATFDLRSGKFVESEYVSPHLARAMHDTKAYRVVVKDGAVFVDVP
ncbi:MAG: Rieske 2Fe-2S domain-containing protein [Candidatus Lokiarchaeota archaeon]|nr:Rieske 2Fe-2S domain-containing protein [Candidatus Lokiarchaeota archaeon]